MELSQKIQLMRSIYPMFTNTFDNVDEHTISKNVKV